MSAFRSQHTAQRQQKIFGLKNVYHFFSWLRSRRREKCKQTDLFSQVFHRIFLNKYTRKMKNATFANRTAISNDFQFQLSDFNVRIWIGKSLLITLYETASIYNCNVDDLVNFMHGFNCVQEHRFTTNINFHTKDKFMIWCIHNSCAGIFLETYELAHTHASSRPHFCVQA